MTASELGELLVYVEDGMRLRLVRGQLVRKRRTISGPTQAGTWLRIECRLWINRGGNTPWWHAQTRTRRSFLAGAVEAVNAGCTCSANSRTERSTCARDRSPQANARQK